MGCKHTYTRVCKLTLFCVSPKLLPIPKGGRAGGRTNKVRFPFLCIPFCLQAWAVFSFPGSLIVFQTTFSSAECMLGNNLIKRFFVAILIVFPNQFTDFILVLPNQLIIECPNVFPIKFSIGFPNIFFIIFPIGCPSVFFIIFPI